MEVLRRDAELGTARGRERSIMEGREGCYDSEKEVSTV